MLYYRLNNNQLEMTNSNFELQDDWIYYEEGIEPKELLDILNNQEEVTNLLIRKAEANQYLLDTNWYYVRKIELGKEVPQDIVAKRLELIQFLNDNK